MCFRQVSSSSAITMFCLERSATVRFTSIIDSRGMKGTRLTLDVGAGNRGFSLARRPSLHRAKSVCDASASDQFLVIDADKTARSARSP